MKIKLFKSGEEIADKSDISDRGILILERHL